MKAQQLEIIKPDDWHLHLRDGEILKSVLPWTTASFARAIVMPNLSPPVDSLEACREYYHRIVSLGDNFQPLMTLYLNQNITPQTIEQAVQCDFIYGVKMYPKNATTHSEYGVTNPQDFFAVFETMERLDLPLLIHGEHVDDVIDIFDREKKFIDTTLVELRKNVSETANGVGTYHH